MTSATPVKTAFVNHYTGYGGAELMLLVLLESLDRARIEPVLMAPQEGLLTERAQAIGVQVEVVPVGSALLDVARGGARSRLGALTAVAQLPVASLRLARAIRRVGAQVVVTNSAKAHVYGSLAGWMARRPVVWRIHDTMDSEDFAGSTRRMLLEIGRRIPVEVLAVSDSTGLPLIAGGVPAARVTTLYNGIDLGVLRDHAAAVSRNGNGVIRVGSIGRMTPLKGHAVVLDAAAALLDRGLSARFVIAGAPSREAPGYVDELRARADHLGIADSVDIIAPFDDLAALLTSLDVLVHASVLPDSLPTTIIESMALGKPVVATRLGGAPELLREGETGLLIPAGDAVAMADRVAELIASPERRSALGSAAFADATTRFDVSAFVDAFADHIEAASNCSRGWVRSGRTTR